MTKELSRKQGEGIAIFKLVGYVKNMPDAHEFIAKYKVKDNKFYFQLQKMMLWGTEYDKIPKFRKGLRTH